MALSSLQSTSITCPVDIDTIIDFVGTFSADEDNLIQFLANSATSKLEKYLGDYLIQRPITWVFQKSTYEITEAYFSSWLNGPQSSGFVTLSAFGKFFELPTKAASITDVSILVGGTDPVSLSTPDGYVADVTGNTGRLRLEFNEYMTELYQGVNAVKVDYVGGMFADTTSVPYDIQEMICVMTKRAYENRQRENGPIITSGIEKELANYRRWGIAR